MHLASAFSLTQLRFSLPRQQSTSWCWLAAGRLTHPLRCLPMGSAASAAPPAPAGAALEDVCPACLQLRHTTGTTPVTLASFLSSVLTALCLPAAMASHTLWTRCSRRPTSSNWLWWISLASTPLLLAHRKSLSEACCVLTVPVGLPPAMQTGDPRLLHTHVASAACRSIGVRPTRNISSPASSSLCRNCLAASSRHTLLLVPMRTHALSFARGAHLDAPAQQQQSSSSLSYLLAEHIMKFVCSAACRQTDVEKLIEDHPCVRNIFTPTASYRIHQVQNLNDSNPITCKPLVCHCCIDNACLYTN